MTPERLEAIAETLRGFRPELDDAAIARMLRAVEPRIEAAVVRFVTAHDAPYPDGHDAVADPEWASAAEAHQDEWMGSVVELREVACRIAPLARQDARCGVHAPARSRAVSGPFFSELMAEILAGCPHREVVPILPAHIRPDSMWSTIEGQCVECGDGPFCMWEAYGYGDAHAEEPYPTRDEVLVDFEAWWANLRP